MANECEQGVSESNLFWGAGGGGFHRDGRFGYRGAGQNFHAAALLTVYIMKFDAQSDTDRRYMLIPLSFWHTMELEGV